MSARPYPLTPLRIIVFAVLTSAGLAVIYMLAGTLLVVFAGVLLAVVLDVAALRLQRLLPANRITRLSIVTLLLFMLIGASLAWGGTRLISEAQNLFDTATDQISAMETRLKQLGILPEAEADDDALGSYLPDPAELLGHAGSTVSALGGVAANAVVILFLGVFFAADPVAYREGFLRLLPVKFRGRLREVLNETGHTLRWWLVGQLVTMAIIAVSIGLMLYAVGIPNAVLLGLLAGLLNFVPFLGPILAAIPVVLASLPEGLHTLMLVLALFIVIESIEGYVINPLIQKRAVYLPLAWSLAALVGFGTLFGGMGVALATPILAVARIMVLRLYVEDLLEGSVATANAPAHTAT